MLFVINLTSSAEHGQSKWDTESMYTWDELFLCSRGGIFGIIHNTKTSCLWAQTKVRHSRPWIIVFAFNTTGTEIASQTMKLQKASHLFASHGTFGRSWWCHQMETFSASLALSEGNPPVHQWRGTLVLSLICAWTNDWANNRDADDLRRHRGDEITYPNPNFNDAAADVWEWISNFIPQFLWAWYHLCRNY